MTTFDNSDPLKIRVIPPDSWKKNRDRISRAAMRKLHLTETNPGPDASRLRYDYVLTRADLIKLVENVMADTERLAVWHIQHAKELR